ncbi:MAG: DUF711 family protein [Chloroflexi bacterium]|nr:DUF711 family protein [Chloroflexota bacterium]
MNIRSVTGFVSLADPLEDTPLRVLGDLVRAARDEFSRAGFPAQTTRVATQSLTDISPRDVTQFARDLDGAIRAHGIDYAALGAVRADDPNASLDLIDTLPNALGATENIFGAIQIASHMYGINLRAIQAAARVIRALADTTPDGFGNFKFSALANCQPHAPFFPVAYHDGGANAFALAVQAAPLAVEAFTNAQSLDDARANLVGAIERAGQTLARIANDLAARFDFRFAGIDFSMAPFPAVEQSIGTAIERLISVEFGSRGTLFAAAFITDCIRRANFPRAGFSGLMLPVLEDATLAARSANYSLDSLLLYSTVCGTGLDTVPLPGDTRVEQLSAILLDLATLAVKLDKPLTARLIPIPGLRAGDMTQFDFQYFANARVLNVKANELKVFESDTQVEFKESL